MQNTEMTEETYAPSEKEFSIIKEAFASADNAGEARSAMAINPDLEKLNNHYRYKIDILRRGKCRLTFFRKDGAGHNLILLAHLRSIPQDKKYPSREIAPYRHF